MYKLYTEKNNNILSTLSYSNVGYYITTMKKIIQLKMGVQYA